VAMHAKIASILSYNVVRKVPIVSAYTPQIDSHDHIEHPSRPDPRIQPVRISNCKESEHGFGEIDGHPKDNNQSHA